MLTKNKVSTPLRVCLHPKRKRLSNITNGVDMVNFAMQKHLDAARISLVGLNQERDVLAAHIYYPGDDPVDVLHCHGLHPTGMRNMEGWAWGINERVITAARDALITTVPSHWVAQVFARDMGMYPRVIPHGIDLSLWPERAINKRTPTVLWNKNRAATVCDPQPVNDLAQATRGMGFTYTTTFGTSADNVVVTGSIPHTDMVKLLYGTGVYLATTKETFGIAVLEALAAGVPVLAWDWGALPDIITHGVDGLLVEPGDIEGTREALLYIMDNQDTMSVAARDKAAQFSWPSICSMYADTYRDAHQEKQGIASGLVTVVIPNYNYANYVVEAIDSVKRQIYENFEVIIIDDGSTDDSVQVITKAIEQDRRFRLITQKNAGVSSARNRGVMEGAGAYVVFLDADDRMLPNCIADLLSGFSSRNVGLTYGKLSIINSAGVVTSPLSAWPTRYNLQKQLSGSNQVASCCMIRRDIFLRAGGFRSHTIPAEDAELWSRIPLLGYQSRLCHKNRPIYEYRVHSRSATSLVRTARKKEPDWLQYVSGTHSNDHMPIASLVPAKKKSHPVLDYDRPVVSIIIPCGPNHKDLLVNALESVQYQTDPRWECVVVDDTAEGDLKEHGIIPYRVRYPWVVWVKNTKKHNVSVARNTGVAASHGGWLTFLDADDTLHSRYLQETLSAAARAPDGKTLFYTDWISLPNGKQHTAEGWDKEALLRQALFAVTFLHSRIAFDDIGGFDENFALWEDWDYVIRLAICGYVGVHIPIPLFTYNYATGVRRKNSLAQQDALIAQLKAKYKNRTGEMG